MLKTKTITITNKTMLRATLIFTLACCAAFTANAQPRYDYSRLALEQLDRGVVAVRQDDGRVFVSWRVLRQDNAGQPFDIFRNGVKLNSQPLTQGGSYFIDEQPLTDTDATYEVRGGSVASGRFTLNANAPTGYLAVALQKPAGGTTPDGHTYTYSANDATVADVDGDGQYEIILKWDPTNSHDNAHDGFTGPTIFDCYKLDFNSQQESKYVNSTLLWRIDLGRNIRSGAHYVPFIVYDLDGDGRAELMVRTSDGTRDGLGNIIGDSLADYRHGADNVSATDSSHTFQRRDEWARYNQPGRRAMTGRILTGPEYITVFDGLTGRAMDTKPYIPERGTLTDWGDAYANRSDRMLAAVGYLDGQHASAIFCRGYYTRSVLAVWEWNGQELSLRWVFDTDNPQWTAYAGQGNHNLRVADVDGDGCDEITYGSMAVDHDGTGLYNTGFGHGDAIHLVADATTGKLYIWDCHENRRDGSDFRDAATGQVVFQIPSNSDVGRCMAADIDPTNPGVEMWSTDSHGVRSQTGQAVLVAGDANDPQHNNQLTINGRRLSVNFGIWWDGDLLRELLDRERVTKYDWQQRSVNMVQHFSECQFNNGTKSNPCLQADMLGDWREEVIVRNRESTELLIYVSTIPTEYRIDCLMQDVPYRLSVAYQNVGYNQPPEAGIYIGPDNTGYLK